MQESIVKPEGWLTIGEVGFKLRVGYAYVQRLVRTGQIKSYRIGPRRIFVKLDDLEAFIQSRVTK